MLRNFLKRISLLSVAVLAIALVSLNASSAKAAEAAFTIHTPGKDYPVRDKDISEWTTPTGSKNEVFISLEPEQNLNNFVLAELGLKNKAHTQVNFSNYNISSIYTYLKDIEPDINRDAEEAVMKIDGDKVTDFNPGTTGQDLDVKSSIDNIVTALAEGSSSADLSISETQPENTLAETNDLGIKELVAQGESNFAGSPKNRIFNIKVGVQKETGTIVKPGEEFSFNKYLGPVDGEHGFLPELVIKATGTVPEFGGGLCQVSSTVFRAAMKAGLPITERRNHSYAVSYYAPQGTDATIYPGVQDMKFVNNTPASLLIWPKIEGNKLYFSLYGTKDTRQVVLEDPVTYDRKPDGSMKASWTRTVTMPDGTVENRTFKSTYQPPALFHKTETFPSQVNPAPAATLPETAPSNPPVTSPQQN